MSTLGRLPYFVLIATTLGCAEPQPGEPQAGDPMPEPGEPEVMDSIEGCRGVPYTIGFDEEAPSGVSAAEIVEDYAGSYASELIWLPPSGPVSHTLPLAPGAVVVELEAVDSDEVRWLESELCQGRTSCALNCLSRLEIPGRLRVTADDGTLAEELDVVIAATKVGVHVAASVQLDALQGSIGPETFTIDSEWTVIDYQLQTEVDDEGRVRGRFLAALTDPDGLLWFNAVGVWPLPG